MAVDHWYREVLSSSSTLGQNNIKLGNFINNITYLFTGYAIAKSLLNSGDFTSADSSIRALAERSSVPFDTLLRGEQSFGKFLEQEGYNAVPSLSHRIPGSEKYFSGGYNTKTYGSRDGGNVDAIQIESSKEQRSEEGREDYAKALARAIFNFMNIHY